MGFAEKKIKAEKANWITEGLDEAEIKTTVELAKISARIEMRRLDMGMTQQEFANYIGVSQGMVSKWESQDYNFTIKTLNDICSKVGLEFLVSIEKKQLLVDHNVIQWGENKIRKNNKRVVPEVLPSVEGIA